MRAEGLDVRKVHRLAIVQYRDTGEFAIVAYYADGRWFEGEDRFETYEAAAAAGLDLARTCPLMSGPSIRPSAGTRH